MNVRLRLTCYSLIAVLVASGPAPAQDDLRVLPQDFGRDKTQQMMRSFMRGHVHAALDARLEELDVALKSRQAFHAYQHIRRDFLRWTLGTMPVRTPLEATVTGRVVDRHFTIEKVLLQSQPGFFVTCNVYVPLGEGPFPAILHSCGHSKNGKAAEAYQLANQLLASNGFVVLCYDPIGQGERHQILDNDGKPMRGASGEHQQLGIAPILLGQSLASYMVWDAVRCLDYLCGRPDVDATRIGCTGNSGGGNLSSYLMAYDERIAAAAPGCFMTTHRRKNESPGPGDAEQNLFAQIREGFDHPDFILTRAPKPTLILAATKDFVPIEGTWEAYRQAKRAYSLLGYPERVSLVETNQKHGFSRQLREGAARFFTRWLQDRYIEIVEPEGLSALPDEQLQVASRGQVLLLDDARSIFDLFAANEQRLSANRPKLTHEDVRSVTGIRRIDLIPAPKVKTISSDALPHRVILHRESGIMLPALHFRGGMKEPYLIAPADGMPSVLKQARELHADGHPVLIVDVRDSGETATRNWRFHGADYYIGYMLGRNYLAMRTEDILVCAWWLATIEHSSTARLIATGEIAPAALHAAALEPNVISSVSTRDGLTSWRDLMTRSDAYEHLHNAVPGALKVYDLPDLSRLER